MDSDVAQYKVVIIPNAMAQLDDIYDYVVVKLQAPGAAKRLNKGLRKAIESLSIFPNRGSVVRRKKWSDKQIRFVIVGNYDIYYRIVEDKTEIHVLAVAYSRRDLKNILGINSTGFCVSETTTCGYGSIVE